MADDYLSTLQEVSISASEMPEASQKLRHLAHLLVRNGMTAAIDAATGPDPEVALLDILVLGSLQPWALEQRAITLGVGHEIWEPLTERMIAGRDNLWRSARPYINEEDRNLLIRLLEEWTEDNPGQFVVSGIRFAEFIASKSGDSTPERVSGILGRLKDATRSVDETRLLGERALWFAARYPKLISEEVNLTAVTIAEQKEFQELLSAVESIKQANASLSILTESLLENFDALQNSFFERVSQERSAAIEQAFSHIADERAAVTEVLSSLDLQTLTDLISESKNSIEALHSLAQQTEKTLSLGAGLAERFDPTSADSIDLAELRVTAEALGEAAKATTRLLEVTYDSIQDPQLVEHLDKLANTPEAIADHVFWRALVLIIVFLVGLYLVIRKTSPRAS